MTYDEDYRKGMKLLVTECKKEDIDYHKLRWLIKFSKMLSYKGVCYKFWLNVVEQKRVSRILHCNTVSDAFYGIGLSLFIWYNSKEGREFWNSRLETIFHHKMYKSFNEDFWQ